jgi:hypothetical protein
MSKHSRSTVAASYRSTNFSSDPITHHPVTGRIKCQLNRKEGSYLSAYMLTSSSVPNLQLTVPMWRDPITISPTFYLDHLSQTTPLTGFVANRYFKRSRGCGLTAFSAPVQNSHHAWCPGCPPYIGKQARLYQSRSDNSKPSTPLLHILFRYETR